MDERNGELLREHYEIESALAARLRDAHADERKQLYSSLYDELFTRVPHHPQLTRKQDPASSQIATSHKMSLLRRFLRPQSTFLEIGPGDCHLSFTVANQVRQVYAVDVSAQIAHNTHQPTNFELFISDGSSVPVPRDVTITYSNQLMEHLHPDDAVIQLEQIFACLMPGGAYVCITPSRFSGPHDISQHFDDVATGFHLKEYTYMELCSLMRRVGFDDFRAYVGGRGRYLRCPIPLLVAAEKVLERLPRKLGSKLARTVPGRAIVGVNLVAHKPASTGSTG